MKKKPFYFTFQNIIKSPSRNLSPTKRSLQISEHVSEIHNRGSLQAAIPSRNSHNLTVIQFFTYFRIISSSNNGIVDVQVCQKS